jgi:hypothetical protein
MSSEETQGIEPSAQQPRIGASLPTIYADQVVDVIYGVYTSKVVLGFENGTATPRPIATVVIPTGTLLTAAIEIVRNLAESDIAEYMRQRHSDLLQVMAEAASRPAKDVRRLTAEGSDTGKAS